MIFGWTCSVHVNVRGADDICLWREDSVREEMSPETQGFGHHEVYSESFFEIHRLEPIVNHGVARYKSYNIIIVYN